MSGELTDETGSGLHELIPGGAQTLSKMRGRFPGAYPRSLLSANRALVFQIDGPGITDWICGLGAISLGYGYLDVDQAVMNQVVRGPIFSLPHKLEERVAQRLVDLIPCAESVRYFKTGSEATEAAIRVARAHTGRDVILTCGYHGWHSWYAATREEHPGVPSLMCELVESFTYNDLPSLDEAIRRATDLYVDTVRGDNCEPGAAAIIVEPTLVEAPVSGFLAGLRERCDRWGALLIFDEMVTGFRWHAGGYQALCGVTPDLATFGKGMGNGYAIAALVGKAGPMRWARLASGTFGGDLIGLAAADATIARYQQGGVCEHMARLGARIIEGYNHLAAKHSEATWAEGQPPHPVIRWFEDPTNNRHRASLFYQELVKRGHLVHPEGMNLMLAHTDADVDSLLAACDEALAIVTGAIRAGNVRELIEGDPIDPTPVWRVTR